MATTETRVCTVISITGKHRRAKPSGPPPNPPGAAACLQPVEVLVVVGKRAMTESMAA